MPGDISAAESVMRKPSSADRAGPVLSVRAIVLWAGGLFVVTCAAIVLALLLVYAHRGNIERLRQGTENRFRTRKGVAA